jgi:hypothetical protein
MRRGEGAVPRLGFPEQLQHRRGWRVVEILDAHAIGDAGGDLPRDIEFEFKLVREERIGVEQGPDGTSTTAPKRQ